MNYQDQVLIGDCRDLMRQMIADGVKVQICVTSPPYFGLRDYGVDGQIGLEPSVDEFLENMVEVFRLVRELLADDGTVWLNLGDSYSNGGRATRDADDKLGARGINVRPNDGAKPKDLIGIPWRVAFALQQPYYTGRIKSESDRIWLAAIIDGEGCFFIHKRKAGSDSGAKFLKADGEAVSYARTADTFSMGLEICNTNKAIIDRIQAIAGLGTVRVQTPDQNKRRKQTIYRWRCSPSEARAIAQEIYPHLVGKSQQARLIFGAPNTGKDASAAHQAMIDLHNGRETDIDFPEPPSLFEPGWYLRQDVIWAKPNPMPESVRDRCTKSHEYIFLLSKSPRYYYDAEAIRENRTSIEDANGFRGGAYTNNSTAINNEGGKRTATGNKKYATPAGWDTRTGEGGHGTFHKEGRRQRGHQREHQGFNDRWDTMPREEQQADGRNKRSVWTVATQPFPGAHFATFPQKLIEPCILAGSRPGDIVFDPFMGAGTTAVVAQQLGRHYLGCELNPEYQSLQQDRLKQPGLLLMQEAP